MSNALNNLVRECVSQVGDPLIDDIYKHICQHGWTEGDVRNAVLRMVNREELHMKEGDIDHDWTYRKGPKWYFNSF